MAAGNTLPQAVEQFMNERCTGGVSNSSAFSQFIPPRLVQGEEVVDAFIAVDNADVIDKLASQGVNVQAVFDGFVTARVPVALLEQISSIAGVTDIDVSRRVELCTDSTLSVTHAGQVIDGINHGLSYPYDGTGVVVGIIDVGFDYQHRAFRKADNPDVTRIVRVYDTRNTSGHPVISSAGAKLPGSVFMNDEIYSLTNDGIGTHGTHTSSIAAGTHVNGYGGMAPGADIVLCAVSVLDGSLSTVEIANCVKYITCYADSVGKPCVMSMSVSTTNGQHDGQDYLSSAIAQNVGQGRIFVISAGNTGGRPLYAHKKVSKTQPINLLFKSKTISNADSSYYYGQVNADIWLSGANRRPAYRWHIIDLKTGQIVWLGDSVNGNTQINSSLFSDYYNGDDRGKLDVTAGISSNGKTYRLDVSMSNLTCSQYTIINGEKQARYAIGLSVYPRDNNVSDVHAWLGHSSSQFGILERPVVTMAGDMISDFYTGSTNHCTIGTYAVNDSIISAGAFAARNSYYSLNSGHTVVDNTITVGSIANFSSFQLEGEGPTGAALPTICAPGIYVVAAASRYSYLANSNMTVMRTDDGSCWGVMSGTSMSAPTVAGIIAQWLQANPKLSVSQVKEILAESAIRDNFTTGHDGAHFGPNGKIDAMAGLRLVLERTNCAKGDVNCDGNVGMDDLTLMINHMLGLPSHGEIFSLVNADINQNADVNMDDLSEMINILLL